MYFLHFEVLHMKWVLLLFKFLLCKVCWSCFLTLVVFTINFGDVVELYCYCFPQEKVVGYLPNVFHLFLSDYLSLNTSRFKVFKSILIFKMNTKHLGIHRVGLTSLVFNFVLLKFVNFNFLLVTLGVFILFFLRGGEVFGFHFVNFGKFFVLLFFKVQGFQFSSCHFRGP